MLPKKQKLTKKDFSFLGRSGKSTHSPHLTLRVHKTPNASQSKFSFVVSKKVNKKSTARNALKRIGYHTIGSVRPQIKPGFSCIFFLKSGSEDLPDGQLAKEILHLLKTAGLFS
ncbi:MAG: ribonuclease P protein component [Parcubacteria group bacterium]|nr:ribonuclease P protein component [Parcubacteria group bacterium]